MATLKKRLVWIGVAAGAAVIILFVLYAAAQYLLRSDLVRSRISAEVSRVSGGRADFTEIEIVFSPRPGLILRDFRLSRPETACAIPALAVYPRLESLLRGNPEVDTVEIGEPDCRINLARDDKRPATPFSFRELDENIARISQVLPAGLTLLVERGKVRISETGGGTLTCSDLHLKTSFNGKELPVDFLCTTAEWGRVSLKGRITYEPGIIGVENLSGAMGGSSVSGVTAKITLGEAPHLDLQAGGAEFIFDELYPWIVSRGWENRPRTRLKNLQGSLKLESLRFDGPLENPEKWRFAASGRTEKVRVDSTALPQPLLIREGRFGITQNELSLRAVKADLLDASADISGKARLRNFDVLSAAGEVSGKFGKDTIAWISEYAPIPEGVRIPPLISVPRASLRWNRNGVYSVQGTFIPQGGPNINLDLAHTPAQLDIRRLTVRDGKSDASLSLKIAGETAEGSFRGVLYGRTVDALYSNGQPEGSMIAGDLSARVFLREPLRSTARGYLRAANILVPLEQAPSFTAHSVSLKAAENLFSVESADLSWGEQRFTAGGAFQTSPENITVDLGISSGWIDLDRLLVYILGEEKRENGDEPDRKKPWSVPFQGVLRVSADRLDYRKLTSQPFGADISIGPQRIGIEFTRLFVCGQAAPGRMVITPDGISTNFRSVSVNQEAEPFLACYLKKDAGLTGRFDLDAEVTGHLKYPESLQGHVKLTMRNGRILRFELLSRILQFVNLTQIFVGRVPDLEESGLAYDRIAVEGRIEGSKLLMKEFLLEGPTLGLAGQGTVDFIEEDIDLSMLVSPLRAADYIIGKIPVVRYLLRGTFVAVPVGAYGHWNDPLIVPLDPSVMGQSILGIFRRVFKLPIKILEPLKSLENPATPPPE